MTATPAASTPLLEVRGLSVEYGVGQDAVQAGVEGAFRHPHTARRASEQPFVLPHRREHLRPHRGRLRTQQRQVAVRAGAGDQLQMSRLGELLEGAYQAAAAPLDEGYLRLLE